MRLTSLSDPPNPHDFVFLCDGIKVGRCKLERLAGAIQKWTWTIYIAGGPGWPSRRVDGIPIVGTGDTFVNAQQYFKDAFERMRTSGVIKPDDRGHIKRHVKTTPAQGSGLPA